GARRAAPLRAGGRALGSGRLFGRPGGDRPQPHGLRASDRTGRLPPPSRDGAARRVSRDDPRNGDDVEGREAFEEEASAGRLAPSQELEDALRGAGAAGGGRKGAPTRGTPGG